MESQASRQKESEFREIYYKFQEQGKRLSECISRVINISCRLESETPQEPAPLANKNSEPPMPPGLTNDFLKIIEDYRQAISVLESQIGKIEKHI